MTKSNIPPGYKQTKIGILPVEWDVVRICKIYTFKNGINASKEDYGFGTKFINVSEIFKNDIIQAADIPGEVNISSKKLEGSLVEDGDILWNRTSETFDEIAYSAIYKGSEKVTFGGFVIRGKRISDIILPEYSIYAFKIDSFREQAIRRAQGAVRANIGQKDIGAIQIPLPPLPEQQKIATILATWDDATRTLTQLINAKREQKRGLMQRLLTGEVRLPGFAGEWRETKLGEVLTESQIEGTNGLRAEKLTVKLWGKGVYRKIDRNPGSKNTNYFLRKAGQLIYSKLDFLNCAFGIIPPELDNLESTLDLPTFDIHDGVDSVFLLERIKLRNFYENFGSRANGSRIARRIHPKMFLSFKVNLPSSQEQTAIAAVLTTADREITLLENQLAELKEQKRGLMQRLLTGQVRVNVATA